MAQVREKAAETSVVTKTENRQEQVKTKSITVYVSGAVKKPGVYTFPEGTRTVEAMRKALPATDAALEYINLAEIMTDAQHIPVPHKVDVEDNDSGVSGTGGAGPGQVLPGLPGQTSKVNINTASAQLLDQLPGIGPSTAQKIIDYRKTQGRFKSISDLSKVPGIGPQKLAKLEKLIKV